MTGYIFRLSAKILTWALALLTLLAAYGGYIPPAVWSTPSVLALAYPYLALLTLIAGMAWLVWRRFFPAIVCGAALLLGSGALLANLPFSSPRSSAPGEKPFTLMTYNVMGGDDVRNPDDSHSRTFQYILDTKADIVCMQEMALPKAGQTQGLTPGMADSLFSMYPYVVSTPDGDFCLLSKYPAKGVRAGKGSSASNCFELYRITIGQRTLHVMNLHLASYLLSPDERRVVTDIRGVRSARRSVREFKGSILNKLKSSYRQRAIDAEAVREIIDSIRGPLVVCGDFNDVPASWAYRTIRGEDLRDAYADTGLGMMVTYNLHGFYFHIDQIFYRGALRALSVKKGKVNSSDHFPLLATFALTPTGN